MASTPKDASSNKAHSTDLIKRGVKKTNQAGNLTFIGLRAVDPLLQYGILAHGWGSGFLHSLGLKTLPPGPPLTGTILDALELSPYRLILFGMSVGTAAKQIYWKVGLAEEEMAPATASLIAVFNSVFNTINTLLFTCSSTSSSLASGAVFPQTPLLVGSALYVVGLTVELASEYQRKVFKSDPKNVGKPCTTGLWSLSRHPNYAGYALWRTGWALAAGGYVWAGFSGGFATADFISRGVPTLDEYCAKRYGKEWEAYVKQTPYGLFPYII